MSEKSFEDRLQDLAAGVISRAAKQESLTLRRQQEEDEFRERFETLLTSTIGPVLSRGCTALRQGGCKNVQSDVTSSRDRATLTLESDGRFYALAVLPTLSTRSVRVFSGSGPAADEARILASVLSGTGRPIETWALEEVSPAHLEARVVQFASDAFK